jgi:hypothetical protein
MILVFFCFYQSQMTNTIFLFYEAVLDIWVKMGGKPWELVEPVDGFRTYRIKLKIVTVQQLLFLLSNITEIWCRSITNWTLADSKLHVGCH